MPKEIRYPISSLATSGCSSTGSPQLKSSDYVHLRDLPPTDENSRSAAAAPRVEISKPAMPAGSLKREQVRRTIVLFIAIC